MHALIVNFNLKDFTEEGYRELAEAIAPAFNSLPGLLSKTWLANKETNTYGGFYVWRDRESMERYKRTDIYKGMLANPHLGDIIVKDFAILENPSSITRGLVGVA